MTENNDNLIKEEYRDEDGAYVGVIDIEKLYKNPFILRWDGSGAKNLIMKKGKLLINGQPMKDKNTVEEKEIRTIKENYAPTRLPREVITKAVSDVVNKEEGLRYNQGKLRYDLLEPFAIQELVRVFTKGAEKYAPHNWLKGMDWSKIVASLKRHIAAFEQGEDLDVETGCFHMAHAAWNALALVSYYKVAPQHDDRQHIYLKDKKVGLDIDDVVCDWCSDWCKKWGYDLPKHWHFSYDNKAHFESFSPEELSEFYLNLPRKIDPSEIPFNPHCYITSRSVPVELTKKWLQKNGFPTVPVYSVGFGQSKVEVAREAGIDYFIDDSYYNFVDLNKNGICTFLLTTQHNQHYDVGYKRVNSLKEFYERFLK
jgi:hypothetical protein